MAAQSKAELMKASRSRKRAAGLVEFRQWVTPGEKQELERVLAKRRAFTQYHSDLPKQV